ncbi:hypothetical protein V2G26_009133 [Clonostachys chloroleuca]
MTARLDLLIHYRDMNGLQPNRFRTACEPDVIISNRPLLTGFDEYCMAAGSVVEPDRRNSRLVHRPPSHKHLTFALFCLFFITLVCVCVCVCVHVCAILPPARKHRHHQAHPGPALTQSKTKKNPDAIAARPPPAKLD